MKEGLTKKKKSDLIKGQQRIQETVMYKSYIVKKKDFSKKKRSPF